LFFSFPILLLSHLLLVTLCSPVFSLLTVFFVFCIGFNLI
jgi:hypothetical protein